MITFKVLERYDFYKLLHPLTLMVTFPIALAILSFLTESLFKGFVIYLCLLIELILFLLLKMLRETASFEKEITHNVITFTTM